MAGGMIATITTNVNKDEVAQELFASVTMQTASLSLQQSFDIYEALREKLGNEMDLLEDLIEAGKSKRED